jgi:hypothetical protein
MKALIHFSFGGHLYLKNVDISTSFLYETQYSTDRGLILYGENLIGVLDIIDVYVHDLNGLMTDFLQNDIGLSEFFGQ